MNASFLRDARNRAIIFQIMAILIIFFIGNFLYSNVSANLERQNIASGFGFFSKEAGFEIAETMINYGSQDSYLKALAVGALNTIKVSLIGNIFAIILGIIVGVMRLSSNWMIEKLSKGYIEVIRNIPLLLQLYFVYAIFVDIFPSVRQALNPFYGVYLSNRGVVIPSISDHVANNWIFLAHFVGLVGSFFWFKKCNKIFEETGVMKARYLPSLFFIFIPPLLVWGGFGFPLTWDIPQLTGFNFSGGITISPEFSSLLVGLVLYTSAFNAEIVRSGINSVKKGQIEAASALGLKPRLTLSLVVLPQALRVIIPPLTSQVLNLTKNSSLAVAIAYPDFLNVSNTALNQTGQAIEVITLVIIVYLSFSLISSLFMNWYNKKVALVER
ncbi:MAG: amino acid ABC transporter permease [Bacteriovoracaceae bacterium]